MAAVQGETSVLLLGAALTTRFGPAAFRWVGSPPGEGIDAVGWRLANAPRLLFSVSTHAGALADGWYDLQVSVIDDSLENGRIVFLDEVGLVELCELTGRFADGELVERYG